MPTNLPPEYYEIERQYRAAQSMSDKISLLEEMIGTIPKHKGTDRLRADLRRKLSKLKTSAQGKKGSSRQDSAFHIGREGAGQVAVIGATNVGKSSLVANLTNAAPKVDAAAYTTWSPTPGMMPVDGVQIQLIDTPPLDRDFIEPEMLNLIRRVDLILLVVDLQTYPLEQFEDTIAILEEHRIVADHQRDRYAGQQRMSFLPTLVVANKNDDEGSDGDLDAFRDLMGNDWPVVAFSSSTGRNVDQLKHAVFERLGIIRVYAKPPGKAPDLDTPFVLKASSTVADFAASVHRDLFEELKAARVWGSATHDGQMVGRDHVLQDGDVVELRT